MVLKASLVFDGALFPMTSDSSLVKHHAVSSGSSNILQIINGAIFIAIIANSEFIFNKTIIRYVTYRIVITGTVNSGSRWRKIGIEISFTAGTHFLAGSLIGHVKKLRTMLLLVDSLFAIKQVTRAIPATRVSVMVCFTTVKTGICGSCVVACVMRPFHISVVMRIFQCREVSRAWPHVLGREVTAQIAWVSWPPGSAGSVPFATRVTISLASLLVPELVQMHAFRDNVTIIYGSVTQFEGTSLVNTLTSLGGKECHFIHHLIHVSRPGF